MSETPSSPPTDDSPEAELRPPAGFARFALAPAVVQALQELGYEDAYPIQVASIPALLDGQDLLGQAQTGTGKTAAFALPILSRLDFGRRQPQALVLTPTRELAIQVAEAFQSYARRLPGFHVLPVYGGQSIEGQLRALGRGVHVVVGTPGRLLDHLRRKTVDLQGLRTVVIDEADEMLRMGFIDEVQEILDQTPATKQVALFSATFPTAIRKVAARYLRDPLEVRIAAPTATVAATSQRYWPVGGTHKLDALTRILEAEDFDAMLVFVNTRTATDELAEKLEARGFAAAALSGGLNQAQREKTIDRLRRKNVDILVATDVAARGLDVERISHVINYDIPFDVEAYIHRIGRTGRAGRKGEAILFVGPRERRMLEAIERATRQPIARMELPSREEISDRRVAGFKKRLGETIASQDLAFFTELIASYRLEHATDIDEIAAALAYLVQRERPLKPPAPASEQRAEARAERARERKPEPRREGAKEPARFSPAPAAGRLRYRVEVGRAHGVEARNLVGAIANEAGIEGRLIGPVRIHDTWSTVDLVTGLPVALVAKLRKTRVGGRPLGIVLLGSADAAPAVNAVSPAEGNGRPEPPRARPATHAHPGPGARKGAPAWAERKRLGKQRKERSFKK